MSWKSQDYVPEPIVAVLIADMDTFPKLPCSLETGCKGSRILWYNAMCYAPSG